MRGKILKNRVAQYVIAFISCIILVEFAGVVAKADSNGMKVEYRTYTAESGWLDWASDGGDCLADNKEVLTGLKMFISVDGGDTISEEKQEAVANVGYSVYSKEADWSEVVSNGSKASSSDNPIKAVKVEISGEATTDYNVEYRVLNSKNEWTKWCSNGEVAGNTGGEENIIGVQAKIVQKTQESQTTENNTNNNSGTTVNENNTTTANTANTNTANTNAANTNTANTNMANAGGNEALEAFVNKAVSQLGTKPDANGVTTYGQWYQDNVDGSQKFNTAAWCAMFLSWCANDAGVSRSTVGYYAACSFWQEQFFVANGTWHAASGYTPARGDLIFFDYTGDGKANHNGIVESVSETQVVAIEGNVDKEVKRCTYELSDTSIVGYGKPDYSKNAENVAADKKKAEEAAKQQEQQKAQQAQEKAQPTGSSGGSGQAEAIVNAAAAELGTYNTSSNWTQYGQWYQDNIDGSYDFSHAAWCAMFVSWCANKVGVSRDIIKPFAACRYGVTDNQNKGVWHGRTSGYVPKKGDIIFFAFNSSASNHVGLVDYVADGHVHTIEGNSDDAVRQRTYSLSYGSILGYGSPNYQ